jgi:glycosyltransferase involved in cell wall biosynthesis
MEGLPEAYQFVLVSRDAEGHLSQDPLFRRIDKHISWQGEKGPPHPEFYQTRNQALGRLVAAKPDLVHFHSGGVFSWGNRWPGASWPGCLKKNNIPSVWTNHSVVGLFHGFCGNLKPWWFKLGMLPWSYFGKSQQLRSTTIEICVSDHDTEKMRRWYFPFRKKIARIYHSRLGGSEIRASGDPREKMILAVGHLALRKGQHILVQAFAKIARQHPSWNLVLVGPESADGCADWIRSFCRKEGLENQVKLMGPRTDAREWMKKCAIFVQPSLEEALGLALQEAMACGCACIGSNVGGIPELIRNRCCGLICNAGDPFLLAQGLESLIHHPDLRAQYGEAAVGHVKALGMTRDAMILAHREIYERCCRI